MPQTPEDRRSDRSVLARRVLGGGREPDPRFTLANERTFLAWIRTSLAFLAGGIALEAFAGELIPGPVRTSLAIGLLVLALLVAATATMRWLRVERAMRRDRPLPLPVLAPLLALGAAMGAGALIGVLVLR